MPVDYAMRIASYLVLRPFLARCNAPVDWHRHCSGIRLLRDEIDFVVP